MNPEEIDAARCRGASHIEALTWAAQMGRPGPFLELGGGWASTPLLHGACSATGRALLTIDSSEEWAAALREPFGTDWHEIRFEPNSEIPESGTWAMAFVDGAAEARGRHVLELRGRADMVVVHDVEPEWLHEYPGLEEALKEWPRRVRFTRLVPHTIVLFP